MYDLNRMNDFYQKLCLAEGPLFKLKAILTKVKQHSKWTHFWNIMCFLYLCTLFLIRGLFNTGLTVFPDLSSIRSDDTNFILWVAITSQLISLTQWSILGWQFLRSIIPLPTNRAVIRAVVSFPCALHTHEDGWRLALQRQSLGFLNIWVVTKKNERALLRKRRLRAAAGMWSQIWGTPPLTRHFSIIN